MVFLYNTLTGAFTLHFTARAGGRAKRTVAPDPPKCQSPGPPPVPGPQPVGPPPVFPTNETIAISPPRPEEGEAVSPPGLHKEKKEKKQKQTKKGKKKGGKKSA